MTQFRGLLKNKWLLDKYNKSSIIEDLMIKNIEEIVVIISTNFILQSL